MRRLTFLGRLAVIPLLLGAVASPAAAYPLLGPEIEVGGAGRWLAMGDSRTDPKVAAGGSNHLVVWSEQRTVSIHEARWNTETACWGALVGPGGELLTPGGLRVLRPAAATFFLDVPGVVFDGTSFVVAVEHTGVEASGLPGATDLYVVRVTPDGQPLDPEGILVAHDVRHGIYGNVALASDGAGTTLLVWAQEDDHGELDVHAARVDRCGVVLDPGGFPVSTATDDQALVDVTWSAAAQQFVAVWKDLRGAAGVNPTYGARLTPAGVVLDADGVVVVADESQAARVAAGPDGALLVWMHVTGLGATPEVYASRLDAALQLLDQPPLHLGTGESPVVAARTDGYTVAWVGAGNEAEAAGVPLAGGSSTPLNLAPGETPSRVALAPGPGANVTAAWLGARAQVRAARVGAGSPAAPADLSTAALNQSTPAAAFDGTNVLVAWFEGQLAAWPAGPAMPAEVKVQRFAPDGAPVDALPHTVGASAREKYGLGVAFDGEGAYLVTWGENDASGWDVTYDLMGAVVGADGVPAAAAPRTLRAAFQDSTHGPRVTGGGGAFLVAWDDGWTSATSSFTRVSSAGEPVDVPPVGLGAGAVLAAGSDGSGFVVVTGGTSLLARRVPLSGPVVDAALTLPRPAYETLGAALACGAGEYLFASTWYDQGAQRARVGGTRFTAAGAVLDATPLALADFAGWPGAPVAAFDGTRFAVAWPREPSPLAAAPGGFDLAGVFLEPSGALLADGAFDLAASAEHEAQPALVGAAPLLALHARFDPRPAVGAVRVRLRTLAATGGAPADGGAPAVPELPGCAGDAGLPDGGAPGDGGAPVSGDAGGGGGDAGGGDGDGGSGAPGDESGCSCRAASAASPGPVGLLLALAAATAARLSRRRR